MSDACLPHDASARIIDDLYAGTLDDVAWRRAILAIADSVRASGAVLIAINPESGALLRYEHHRLDPQIMVEYQKHWTYEDVRRKAFLDFPPCVPVTERMLPIDADWKRTAILNEFLTPADVPYFMPAWLHKSPNKVVTLSFQGTRKRGPFEPQDLAKYTQVLPHIVRALEIRDRLEQAQVRVETLSTSLDRLSWGVIVLDSCGRLLEANAVAQRLLRRESGVRVRTDGTLCLRDPEGAEFSRLISTRVPLANDPDGLLHVSREQGPPLSILVTPLPVRATAWLGDHPRWLLLLFDPDRPIEALVDMIGRDLGVSIREAEVAALLAGGYRLRQVAERFHLSEHTVRAQVKSIFRKTGARSQSDLIRRIALGPAGNVASSAS